MHHYSTLENQTESLIYEAISLISIGDSSVKLTRNGETNNLYLRLARDGHWQRKWITASSSSANLHPRQQSLNGSLILSACLPITQWLVSTVTVVYMTSRPRPSYWLVSLLSIKGQVSIAVEQDYSLTQDRLASRKNFHSISKLTEASGIPSSIEENSGKSAPGMAGSSALQFPGTLLFPGTHTSDTLVKHPERISKQRRHSLRILELFRNPNTEFIAALLSEKTETLVKDAPLVRIHWVSQSGHHWRGASWVLNTRSYGQ